MRAAVTKAGGGFEVANLPDPAPEPGQLVLRVTACGVCGSDLKAHRFMPPGTVMGHEMCGEVVAVDRGVEGWREGARAAVLPLVSCGTCGPCSRGEVAHCAALRPMGMGRERGGFAQFVAAPARHAFRLPEDVPLDYGALVEPFAVGLHAAAAAAIGPGSRVLVVGAGGVGQTAVAWARALGAERVTAADPVAARRELAGRMGATDVLASAGEATGEAYDAVIECVGRPEPLDACVAAAAHQGTIVIAGACEHPLPISGPALALKKELSLRFSMAYRPDEFRRVIDAFATGLIDPSPVLGATLGLDGLDAAFELVRTTAAQGRVLISPDLAAGASHER